MQCGKSGQGNATAECTRVLNGFASSALSCFTIRCYNLLAEVATLAPNLGVYKKDAVALSSAVICHLLCHLLKEQAALLKHYAIDDKKQSFKCGCSMCNRVIGSNTTGFTADPQLGCFSICLNFRHFSANLSNHVQACNSLQQRLLQDSAYHTYKDRVICHWDRCSRSCNRAGPLCIKKNACLRAVPGNETLTLGSW